jgi:hypothetical protein
MYLWFSKQVDQVEIMKGNIYFYYKLKSNCLWSSKSIGKLCAFINQNFEDWGTFHLSLTFIVLYMKKQTKWLSSATD